MSDHEFWCCGSHVNGVCQIESEGAMPEETKPQVPVHPVQAYHHKQGRPANCPQSVTLRAYEVYCAVYGAQEAMVTGTCRGGFAVSELIAFLYAHSFPKQEWRQRVDEAFRGMENL